MNKSLDFSRRALNLSLAIYRITTKFPNGEALSGQMRKIGNEVAGDLAANNFSGIEKKIDRLKIYFAIAKAQNWVKPINWSILEKEYCKLKMEVDFELRAGETEESEEAIIVSHNIKEVKKRNRLKSAIPAQERLNYRQSKILTALDKKSGLKMSELVPLFNDEISERTLRNELQDMVRGGLIKKNGTKKYTEYLKG
ncbi:MAG TPA: hypothetical protein P5089_00925 [Candidatus Portnoybacteria bacterium]|nr:hypothetical protein [Candidatus Portnoybacteria bacterium]